MNRKQKGGGTKLGNDHSDLDLQRVVTDKEELSSFAVATPNGNGTVINNLDLGKVVTSTPEENNSSNKRDMSAIKNINNQKGLN